jgi:hypothetical protein
MEIEMGPKKKDDSPQLGGKDALKTEVYSGAEPSLALSHFNPFDLIEFLNAREQRLFSCDCAEHIVSIFEQVNPDQPTPREAIIRFRQFLLEISSLKKLHRTFHDSWVRTVRLYGDGNWPSVLSDWYQDNLGIEWQVDCHELWHQPHHGWTNGLDLKQDAKWAEWTVFMILRDNFTISPRSVAMLGITRTQLADEGYIWHQQRLLEYIKHKRSKSADRFPS